MASSANTCELRAQKTVLTGFRFVFVKCLFAEFLVVDHDFAPGNENLLDTDEFMDPK